MEAILVLIKIPALHAAEYIPPTYRWELLDKETGEVLLENGTYTRRGDARRQAKVVARRAEIQIVKEEFKDEKTQEETV